MTWALPTAATAKPAANPQILSPRSGKLVRGNTVRLRIRGAGHGFAVLVGDRDVTRRFGPARGGVRTARLRRGRDFHAGSNRISFGAGSGPRRRYAIRTFLAPRHAAILHLKRIRGRRAAAPIHLRGRTTTDLGRLRVTVDGRRVNSRFWPRGDRSFEVLIGADDGLHYGRNRVAVVVTDRRQRRFDRVVRTFRLPRGRPLPGAGPDRRATVRRGVPLRADSSLAGGRDARLRYHWRIVKAPRGSKAELRHARSRRGRLVPDLPGTYRLRLTVGERRGSRGASGTARARASLAEPAEPTAEAPPPTAQDTMTVEAAPSTPPIGLPVQTLTGKGIEVGGKLYPAERGVWVQMLVFDRYTLEFVKERTFSKYVVTPEDASALAQAVGEADSGQLVILSGGDRERDFQYDQGFDPEAELDKVLQSIGAEGFGLALFDPAGAAAFRSGSWSAIGVPGSAPGSASQNLTGAVTGGMTSGTPVGLPGSLQGWLQVDSNATYSFVSPDAAAIDTYAEGSGETVNVVTVGSQTYTSGQIAAGGGGFHVLTFDDGLANLANLTYETNVAGGAQNLAGEEALFDTLFHINREPGETALVIVQSIGTPGGTGPFWVSDNGIAAYEWANLENTANATSVPNSPFSWASHGNPSIASEIGLLGGPVAHDQFAQMAVTGFVQPTPARAGGYTLVAPIGAPEDAVSQSQVGSHLSEPRVAGTLSRTAQSNWTITNPSGMTPFDGISVFDVAYQAPTEWPLSTSPGDVAANAYIAKELNLDRGSHPVTDVREAYYVDDTAKWETIRTHLTEVGYPAAKSSPGFTAAQFGALKQQLLKEMRMVAEVQGVVDQWKELVAGQTTKSSIDLQSIATKAEGEITEEIEDRKAGLDTDAVVGDVLGMAGGIAGVGTLGTASGALSALSDTFWLADALAQNPAGSLSVLPVEELAAELGPELAARYEQIQANAVHIGDILVSDWGKLQAASQAAAAEWSLNSHGEGRLGSAMTASVKRQIYAAILPLVYGEYLIGPVATDKNPRPVINAPWTYTCTDNDFEPESTQPLAGSENNPGSWITFAWAIEGQPSYFFDRLQTRVLAAQGDFAVSEGLLKVIHEPHVIPPKLSKILFEPLNAGGLGIDQVEFLGDPAFQRWPLTC